MAFKPIDPKRDEFRRYLERSGVIEALTKVFVRIVKERPENPLEYLRYNLGDSLHQADSMVYLQSELEEARSEIQRLRGMIESVNPDALNKQQQPRDEVGKNDEETTLENREKSIVSISKPREKSQSVEATVCEAPLGKDSIQPEDQDTNLETPGDTINGNNPLPANAAQVVDNSS
ncbi:PREDICTED: C-Myc-binding protein homolog [Rhagoletis zephyria]|uniref:C-Myc-binding protein homolog n=1 Tax=Rhagoletis zephyria TaxID=28612 RepID=UPI000811AAF0|nr:PREDICTED: C-Myc-binding protein homolog [Rhagoletis zephyria]XP_017486702.1 PREDICTED: C-Myc-binding protein homolog [Rhagoletis zephyria]XP_036336215.1 c-Myc-binding protein homolog [Rhagoletis pomonella]